VSDRNLAIASCLLFVWRFRNEAYSGLHYSLYAHLAQQSLYHTTFEHMDDVAGNGHMGEGDGLATITQRMIPRQRSLLVFVANAYNSNTRRVVTVSLVEHLSRLLVLFIRESPFPALNRN
jgi:hypothetical protein